MTLHFHWLRAPHWLPHAHVDRAMKLVLGVIGVSLLFSALKVLDGAISGALIARRGHGTAMAPAASGAPVAADSWIVTEPTGAGAPKDASLVEVPEATVEAISL